MKKGADEYPLPQNRLIRRPVHGAADGRGLRVSIPALAPVPIPMPDDDASGAPW
jgi:hypothetical protein